MQQYCKMEAYNIFFKKKKKNIFKIRYTINFSFKRSMRP